MAITIRNLDHVVLRVSDVERAITFYGDVLGCAVERRVEKLGLYQLRAGSALIDLVDVNGTIGQAGGPAAGAAGHNMDHFCVRVEPFDAAAIAAHLEAHGIGAGPVEQRYGAEGDGPSIYLKDPDGNTVELKGPPDQS